MTPTERLALEMVMEAVNSMLLDAGMVRTEYGLSVCLADLRREAERENVENGR